MSNFLHDVKRFAKQRLHRGRDVDALAAVLFDWMQDLDEAKELPATSTAAAFGRQWRELPEGDYLLSDPWFRENVDTILSAQEILLEREWFKGKKVMDAGCGNGRWSYGLSKLGADLTSVDINDSALSATREALSVFDNPQRFIRSPLEELDQHTEEGEFDLVFSWGVVHHTVKFNQSLDNLCRAVKPRGVLYLYLYGRDSVSRRDDIDLFKERLAYNVLMSDNERRAFLKRKAHGNPAQIHNMHDTYAPLINRRFTFAETAEMLAKRGFTDCVRTMDHPEVFVRATRGDVDLSAVSLPPKQAPFWFEGRHL